LEVSVRFNQPFALDHVADAGDRAWPGRIDEPSSFLHEVDLARQCATFVPTTRAALARAPFLDGREDFSAGAAWRVPLEPLPDFPANAPIPDRYIFHVSFCGSTYLSRLLDIPGRTIVLREPNCLVDLTDWRRKHREDERFAATLDWTRALLRRRWAPNEAVVVKPSSWANFLADALTARTVTMLPLFVTMEAREFLVAVLRGGRERIAYTARLASQLSVDDSDGEALLLSAMGQSRDPLGSAVHLAALAHGLQMRLFDRLRARGGWGDDHVVDFATITAAPVEAGMRASFALDLGLDRRDIEDSVAANRDHHAKAHDIAFSLEQRREEDRVVLAHHQPVIDTALRWAEQTFG
jgi:hypothetical protein